MSDRTSIINGVNDLIVYLDKDFLFISDKKSYKKNSKLIENLKKENKMHLESVNEIHRPWGFYEILDKKDNFLTKKITIYPNTKLSYQKHNHRSEHWVVISGVISVVINDRTHTLKKNQSIDIPKKSKHRMINESKNIAEVIEVQLGKIISEDDIIRYEDEYDRS